jgi:hypothetical protein
VTAPERFVLLGLGQVRANWFREVSRWATSAALPIEFLKAISVEEVRVRLRSGRGYSAFLVDDTVLGLDRDLTDLALDAGCAVIVVDNGRARGSWIDLGASAVLPSDFGPTDLLQVLGQVARPVTRPEATTGELPSAADPSGYRGRLVAVIGPGGTGCSTVAMAVAQGLAADPRHAELVCLADLALDAHQAMLHDARDVVPGVTELVEAHRGGAPSAAEVRSLTWRVEARGYHLLLGLRRHRDWTSIRPRSFHAALDGLRRGFRVVVADIDDDLEGERTTGSVDIEERNGMARSVASAADLVLAVGAPGMRGLHSLLRLTRDLLGHGVPASRILPIVNRSPRGPKARAEITRAFGQLIEQETGGAPLAAPIHLGERRHLEEALRDGARLPDAWSAPVCSAVLALLDVGPTDPPVPTLEEGPLRVVPGSLGRWTEQDDHRGQDVG